VERRGKRIQSIVRKGGQHVSNFIMVAKTVSIAGIPGTVYLIHSGWNFRATLLIPLSA
jgi:hypothetical protein